VIAYCDGQSGNRRINPTETSQYPRNPWLFKTSPLTVFLRHDGIASALAVAQHLRPAMNGET
jgi:hypothetical protein